MSLEQIDPERCDREELVKAFRDCTAQLEAVTREFDQFSHSVSHDLRAPLRALEGFSEILIEDYGQQLDGEAKRCLEIIATSSRKASLLIEDLLMISRFGRQKLEFTRLNMRELVAEQIDVLRPASDRVEFKIGDLPDAWGDRAALSQIWHNLLDNAIKFSGGREQPVVEITGRVESDHTAYCVKDNGAGFDMRYVGRLFGVFQRLHSDQEFPGRGTGLAMVQRVVRRHGGEVWAEGTPQSGAAFYFSLPLEKSEAQACMQSREAAQGA